jgi:hypothetical protein
VGWIIGNRTITEDESKEIESNPMRAITTILYLITDVEQSDVQE